MRRDIDKLTQEVHELFEELWRVPHFAAVRRGFRPAVDVYTTDEPRELTIVVDLPGVNVEDVRIAATDRHVLISGERARARLGGQLFQVAEVEYGPFERHLTLVEAVDPTGAKATYERGFLRIVLPIASRSSGPVKVSISTAPAEEAEA